MKNIKYLIIVLIVILVIVSISIILLNKEKDETYYDDTIPQDTLVELQAKVHREENDYSFFGLEDFVNLFLKYINTEQENAIYQLLDNEFRKQVDIEKMISNVKNGVNINKFYAEDLYKKESTKNLIYYMAGTLESINNQDASILLNMYFELCVDNNNMTASIKILSEEEYNKKITDTSDDIEEKTITKNEYNTYHVPMLTTWQLAERYILNYKFMLEHEVEQAFNLLDAEYREKKFHNEIQEFKDYIQENKDILYNIEMCDCKSEITEEYIKYIIEDYSGNIYIIKRKSAMDYTILLDNNTI